MSYTFTPAQYSAIQTYAAQNNYAAAYQVMADATANINDPDVKLVHTWLQGAGAINQGVGPFSALVYSYTKSQADLRGVPYDTTLNNRGQTTVYSIFFIRKPWSVPCCCHQLSTARPGRRSGAIERHRQPPGRPAVQHRHRPPG